MVLSEVIFGWIGVAKIASIRTWDFYADVKKANFSLFAQSETGSVVSG